MASGTNASLVEIVVDSHDLERTLAVLQSRLSSPGLSMFLQGAVAPWLKQRAEERFAGEGDDVSGPWLPLAESTQDIRSRGDWGVGASHPINVRTGDLERWITEGGSTILPWAHGAMMIYPESSSPDPVLATKIKTAQAGKSRPKTPPRPVLGVNERDLAYVMGSLAAFVTSGKV